VRNLSAAVLSRSAVTACVALVLLATLPLFLLENASIGLWLMQIIPLGLVLPGVARLNKRSLQWLGFIVLFLLVEGILQLFVPLLVYRVLGAANTFTCLVAFFIAIIGIRRPPEAESVP